jgi:AcrR family transcriptional regulator
MPSNNTIKEDIIQEQILQAAQQLFQKHGLHKVTMDDVAKAIGKGRSSLYYYYKSKDEIFDAVIDVEIRDITAALTSAMHEAATIEQKIHSFCTARIKIARKKKAFFEALETGMNADEITQYAQKKLAINKRMMKEETSLLRQVISQGIKKGELPGCGPKELESVIFVLLSSLRGLKREMMLENDYSRVEAAIDTLTRMTMQVLGS